MREDVRAAAVVTVSDRAARGDREDETGPRLVDALESAGWRVRPFLVPDGAEPVEAAIREALAEGARLVLTTGGTGVGPRDETPEGTRHLLDRELPGLAEELRRRGIASTPTAVLSRGLAGVSGRALVVNLPGSPAGAVSGAAFVLTLADHVLAQLEGGDH